MTTRHTLSTLVGIAIALGTTRVTAGQDIAPYYDEESDTVIYHFAGETVSSVESQAAMPAEDRITPYYDEGTDTVVYHFAGTPDAPARTRSSSQVSTRSTWYYDKGTETIVYHHAGQRITQAIAMMGAPE